MCLGSVRFAGLAAMALVFATAPSDKVLAASSSALSDEPIPMVTEAEVRKRQGKPANHTVKQKTSSHDSTTDGHHSSKLSEDPAPLVPEEEIVKRAAPLIEEGEDFLKTGNLSPGIELPTGAIWQPALWVFGDFRTTAGHFDNGVAPSRQYWSNRLDIFFNLKFTPTERILLGISPLSNNLVRHTGVLHTNPTGTDFIDGFNIDINTLFFEGEFGEIFPNLDPNDEKQFDVGFSIGRQPIFFQEGMMINDSIDALAITRDTIVIPGITPDWRLTGLFGWGDIGRDNNLHDGSAFLLGLFSEIDLRKSTVNFDAAYVISERSHGGDGLYLGASAIQRFGHYNTAFRVNASFALENSGPVVDDGVLLFGEVSRTMTGSEDVVYANGFLGIDNYSSAARDRNVGGPLGQTGILFAAPPASFSGPALSNRADDAFGGAIGYQMFFNNDKTQLTLEIGGRKETKGPDSGVVAIGGQFLHALDNRTSLQVDAFISEGENRGFGSGARAEIRVRF